MKTVGRSVHRRSADDRGAPVHSYRNRCTQVCAMLEINTPPGFLTSMLHTRSLRCGSVV